MTARAARVVRGISLGKASILVFVLVAVLTTLFMVKMTQGQALPSSSTDQTVVPHYFGPWPNWALSPLTLSDANVTITGDVRVRQRQRAQGPVRPRAEVMRDHRLVGR